MIEYLDKIFSERALRARTEHKRDYDLTYDPKRTRFADVDMAFTRAIPKELEKLHDEYLELQADLDMAESDATYRAGWLDGVAVGVAAALRK